SPFCYWEMRNLLLAAVATLLLCSCSAAQREATSCGYNACPKPVPGRYNVHLVPHTHDDVGWLRTVDQYYYYEVQFIIDTVIEELLDNPERKFTYVKQLVKNGQLQFALGGWCMDDEATTHYVDIIDQHTQGLRFLNDTFGDCGRPRVAWQVDPFGHSKEHTAMLAQMGFDGLYYGRIDYQDQALRRKTRRMEMVWQASQDIGSPRADLFSGKLYDGYCQPGGFGFEYGDEPVQDDPQLYDYNVEQKVKQFVDMVNSRRQVYSSDHLMLTMGCDFQYQNARKNFKIYDKLIKAVNARTAAHNITVYYSTPSCYTKSVHDQNLMWTVKSDDFFPYAHQAHAFWTGYFTSRAALKRYVRTASNQFQAIKQTSCLAGLQRAGPQLEAKLDLLRQAMGVVQHHDGVSGTEKQVVAYDYALRVSTGINQAYSLLQSAWANLTGDSAAYSGMSSCSLANISYCPFTDSNNNFYLHFYNPVSHPVWHLARIPVKGRYYVVSNQQGQAVTSQTIPVNNGTLRVPERAGAKSSYELVFNVSTIPAMGFVVYRVAAAAPGSPGVSTFTPIQSVFMDSKPADGELDWRDGGSESLNERESLDYRPVFAPLKRDDVIEFSQLKEAKKSNPIGDSKMSYMAYYYGYPGNNSAPEFTASGAYLFRPTKQTPERFSLEEIASVTGPVVNETHVVWSNWTYQVLRKFANNGDSLQYSENELTVGPIPYDANTGREVIVRYNTQLNSSATFYTDANGRQVLRRVRDYRPTWPLQQTENVSGNYYPINSQIFLNQSDGSSFMVLTDRSEGGGSINDGQIEIMLHRITVRDDALGVGEALQEKGSDGRGLVVKVTHWLAADQSLPSSSRRRRELANRRYREPLIGYLTAEPKVKSWSGLRRPLPENVQVVTLDDWRGPNTKLLRLEHLYQIGEHPALSQPVTVALGQLFATFNILSATELTLAANQNLNSAQRLQWRTPAGGGTTVGDAAREAEERLQLEQDITVTLRPMQIRTFVVQVQYL
uniref:Alpha-mannosidase n=1 Tax=Macrostomum lignano TaxID=282301 RepID=A0A1I8J3I0_9PLAT